jgi:hypothetical protein
VTFSTTGPTVPAATEELHVNGCDDVRWEIQGPAATPARATGPSVKVAFAAPGSYLVTARCGGDVRTTEIAVCDFAGVIGEAAAYYGSSIDFTQVTIEHGPTVSGASWVAHNKVNISEGILGASHGCPPPEHYVHELGHVWEHQHGMMQLLRGLMDQVEHQLVGDVYDFGGHDGVRQALKDATGLDGFNLEQIAEIFAEDFAMKRRGIDSDYARDLSTLTRPHLTAAPLR